MSVVVIWASPNKDGLTSKAKDAVILGLKKSGKEVNEIHLNDKKIESCKICGDGWGLCKAKGQCVINDDMQKVYEEIINADGIVWITPVYWHDVAENLKSFLDRVRRCETKVNHSLKAKENIIIACAGGSGNGAIECLHNLETTLKHMEMKVLDRVPVIQFNRGYMLPALEIAGEKFGEHLENK